jgi:flagellar hook-associated protein 2
MAVGVESSTSVSFSGLQSGIDSDKIVDAAVKVAEQPIRHLDRQEAILLSHKETYTQVHSLLRGIESVLQQMQSHHQFGRLSATTSDSNVITAKAGAGSSANSYRIEVKSLAQAQRTYSDPIESASEPGSVGSGAFEMSRRGEVLLHMDVDEETSLQAIADAINDSGAGASAALIFDGESYRLQVTATQAGEQNALSFSDSGLKTNMAADENTSQKAQDATFLLDGFSTITRPTNVISDVIPGVTLSLGAVSSSPQTVSTSVDAPALVSQVEHFISSYNELVNAVAKATHFDGQTDHAKSVGDTTLNTLVRNLQSTVGSPISGLGGDLRALSQAGVSSQKDGTLKLDQTKLTNAINKDARAVARLFVYDPSTKSRGVASKMQALVSRYTTTATGTLSVSIDSITKRTEALHVQKAKMQANVKQYETTLRDRYSKLEKQMSQIKSQNNYLDALKPQQNKR